MGGEFAGEGFTTSRINEKLTRGPQEIGSDVLEMDLVFTADGVPVIWHDVSIPLCG